jgi:ABC-type uncharacterized transport system auxiliary subunit
MMRALLLLISLVLVVLSLSCSMGKSVKTRYYLLDYVPTPAESRLQKGSYPFSLQIKDFSIAEAFKRNQIVYRKSAHELNFYNFELWAVRPEYLVADMVFKHFFAAQLFEQVSKSIGQQEPDYILTGEIHAIEEYDNKNEWFAHLALSLKLYEHYTNREIWSKDYDFRKRVPQTEVVFLVRELSFILETIVDDAISQIDMILEMQSTQGHGPAKKEIKPTPPASAPSYSEPLGPVQKDSSLPPPEQLPPPPEQLPPPEDIQ